MLESELNSINLLAREGENGLYGFTHQTWQEYFTAKYFAERINSGELSVKDCWLNYWSYPEDKELWELEALADEECRGLLPRWQSILLDLAEMLEVDKCNELLDNLAESYFRCEEILGSREPHYNPFSDNLLFAAKVVGKHPESDFLDIKKIKDELFHDHWPILREPGIMAVGDIGGDESVDFLSKYIREKGTVYNQYAFHALSHIGNAQAVEFLIDYVTEKLYTGMKEQAFAALGRIGGQKVVEFLVNYLQDKEKIYHKEAIWALENIDGKNVVDVLINYVRNKTSYERAAAAFALGSIAGEEAVPILVECFCEKMDFDYDNVYLRDKYKSLQRASLAALLAIGGEEADKFLSEYGSTERNLKNLEIAAVDAKVIRGEGVKRRPSAILSKLLDEEDLQEYEALAETRVVGRHILGELTESLMSSNDYEKEKALHALGETKDGAAVPILADYLQNERNQKKYVAVWALGKIGSETAVEVLIDYVNTGKSWDSECGGGMRVSGSPSTIEVIGQIGGKMAVDFLVQYMEEEGKSNRIFAAHALVSCGDRRALKAILKHFPLDESIYKIHQRLKPTGYQPEPLRDAA